LWRRDGYGRIDRPVAAQQDHSVDVALVQRVVARDEGALAALYDRHSRLAYSVVLRVLRNPTDAEEVLQETFVRVWSRAETYDGRLGSPAAWLTRIARNRAIDRLRAKRARSQVDAALPDPGADETPRPEPATTETPEQLVQEAATAGALRGALALLPAAQRALIEAAFFDGFTHQELAERFKLPLGTVKTRIRAGLLSLRGRLEQAV
jgi:RNA polymerase sigma-70 factor (ECF subfamily)